MALYFAITLFVSAFLLFLIQPMVGKMVLPMAGGSPSVWATCMVFFQALLLAGYSYAHAATRRFGPRRQSVLHMAIMALPLVAMGISVVLSGGSPIHAFKAFAPQGGAFPFLSVILLLMAAVGLPFFVVATSAPLLQRWFADTNHQDARDPYFLYSASNLGSLIALVAYPAAIEMFFPLATQAWLWAAGYAALVALTVGCGARLRASPPPPAGPSPKTLNVVLSWRQRLRWTCLALVPTSLMLGVTNFLTTDITPMPLLWVIPLALYLLTFIIAFGRTPPWFQKTIELISPVAVLILLFTILGKKPPSFALVAILHLAVFFIVALNCHLELARSRPPASRLTEFYLWVSLGGVLGGLCNALIAPLIFSSMTEYPLAYVAACLLQPAGTDDDKSDTNARLLDFVVPIVVGLLTLALLQIPLKWLPETANFPIPKTSYYKGGPWVVAGETLLYYLIYGPPMLLAYFWVERPMRFGLAVGALWLMGTLHAQYLATELYHDRSFFGVLSVEPENDEDETGQKLLFHKLVHGTTVHGKQQFDPLSLEPMTYYHRTGPIGQLFAERMPAIQKGELAFVGLGTGTMAAYAEPGQKVTFYEIDPAVKRLAEDPNYFTFLRDCKGTYTIDMGDARLKMEQNGKDNQYGVIVVDAFSSDAIPIHLLTKEAVELYRKRLAPDGVIALHVSNRYLNLVPVAAGIAKEIGMVGITQWDGDRGPPGKLSSEWVLLANKRESFGSLPNQTYSSTDDEGRQVQINRWDELKLKPDDPKVLWTDDFSNLLQIINWKYIFKVSD